MSRDRTALGRALSRDRRSSDRFDRFLLALILLIGLGMLVFHAVLFTFVIAMLVAYLLHPFVTWLHQRRVPRWAGTIISYVLLIGGLTGFVLHVIPKVEYEASKLVLKLNVVLDDVPGLVDSVKGSFDSVLSVLPGDTEDEGQASAWGSDASLARDRSLGQLRAPVMPDERAFRAGLPGLHRRPGGEIDVVEVSSGHYRVRLRGEGLKITPSEGGYLVRAEAP
jgi:AI-2E family transporter